MVFQQLRSTLLLKMPCRSLLWQMLAFSPLSIFNDLTSILVFRRHCDVALFNPSFCFVRIVFFSWFIHLTGVSYPLFMFLPFYQLLPLFNRSAVWNHSYPLCHSFISSEGSMLLISSSILSSCQVLVNSFHLQSECCPNYIILNPSLSCFNRSGFNIYLALQPQGFFSQWFFVPLF